MVTLPTSRNAPCPCESGRKYKACCHDRDQRRETQLEASRASERRLDAAVRVVLPVVAEQGEELACAAGCNACCTNFIRTTAAEATRIAGWLREPERAEVRARFEERLVAWSAAIGPEVGAIEEVLAAHVKTGRPLHNTPDAARFAEAVLLNRRRDVMCPFNDEAGRCTIYPVRPVPCRVNYVVRTAEFCRPDRGRGPSVVTHPELREAITFATSGLRAASASLPERALPLAVAAALKEG